MISEQAPLWLQPCKLFSCTDIPYMRTDGESASNEKHCLLSFLETNAKGYSEEKSKRAACWRVAFCVLAVSYLGKK